MYFDPFDANEQLTGEFPLGNCPGLSLTINTPRRPCASPAKPSCAKDGSWVIQVDRTGALRVTTSAPAARLAVRALRRPGCRVTGEKRTVIKAASTSWAPSATRWACSINGRRQQGGTTAYVAGTGYNVDTETGRVQIIEGGGIASGSEVQFGYAVAASFESVKSGRQV